MIHKSPNGFPNLINEELNKIFNELMALIVFMFLVVSNQASISIRTTLDLTKISILRQFIHIIYLKTFNLFNNSKFFIIMP